MGRELLGRGTRNKKGMGHRVAPALVAIIGLFSVTVPLLPAAPAHALSSGGVNPADPPSLGGDVFVPPANGFNWKVADRFGPLDPLGMVDYHYCAPENNFFTDHCRPDQPGGRPGVADYHYDPEWVHPTALTVSFDGCPSQQEEDAAGATTNTYNWSIPARSASVSQTNCHWSTQVPLPAGNGVGTPTEVRLTMTDPNGNPVLPYPSGQSYFSQIITPRDYLIASIGDSYGSGEGNPDIPQSLVACGFLNLGTCVDPANTARWQDRRCHRSAEAGAAQAALRLEAADPHSSVTFVSFACSGATIETVTSANENPLDPYAPTDGSQVVGSGILGSYRGVDPPTGQVDPNSQAFVATPQSFDPSAFLPDQISQLTSAVGSRPVDALLVSAGGNDMGFGRVATVCVLVQRCPQRQVTNANDSGLVSLDTRVNQDLFGDGATGAKSLGAKYDDLAARLNSSTLNISKLYLTEYPDPTRDTSGGYCGAILDDVIPTVTQVAAGFLMTLLFPALGAGLVNGVVPPFKMSNDPILGNEVQWAGGLIPPSLSSIVDQAATAHQSDRVPWRAVDGIAADFQGTGANSYGQGHGYCASDGWIRRATDANVLQGPYSGIANQATKGTLHPNGAGQQDIATRLFADHLRGDLLPPAPVSPPPSPQVTGTSSTTAADGSVNAQSVVGANGWLIGCTGPSCVGSSPVYQLVAHDAAGIRGVTLSINGSSQICGATTVSGVSCNAGRSADRQTYTWTFRFPGDGAYRLDVAVRGSDGSYVTSGRDVKVDLHDPNTPTARASSTTTPQAGWYRSPVDVTFDGTDAVGGSGIQGISYQIDNAPAVLVTARSQLPAGADPTPFQAHITADGVHTVSYWGLDWAGRTTARQSLTVQLDTALPAVSCGAADGSWHPADVAIGCAAADSGSGLASSGDASFGLSTAVPAGTETANAATGTRTVCDIAGNCAAAGPIMGNKVDKKPPVITVTSPAPSASYYLRQSVAAAYSCADGGSGVGSCTGSLPNGGNLDTASLGSKMLTVNAADNVGNIAAPMVVPYTVSYRICPFYNQTQPILAGSTLPVKLQICDANGVNLSSSAVALTAVNVVNTASGSTTAPASAGSANLGNQFRWSDGTYVFNLMTTGLTSGTYQLRFTVANDPIIHSVGFVVR